MVGHSASFFILALFGGLRVNGNSLILVKEFFKNVKAGNHLRQQRGEKLSFIMLELMA